MTTEQPVTAGRWTDPTGHDWTYRLEWALVAGRLECVGITLRATGERSAWTDTPIQVKTTEQVPPAPLTSSVLRQFPLGAFQSGARKEGVKLRRKLASIEDDAERRAEIERRIEEWEQASVGRPGPKGYGPAHFAEVAEVYRGADGYKPTRAVAEKWSVSPATAAKWVARCRTMGLLPATSRGKPS